MRKDIREMVLQTMKGFYKNGTVSNLTLKEVKTMCLPKITPFSPRHIAKLRKKFKLSQAAFAQFLNTSLSTIQKWERGDKRPSGPALKLLHIVDEKGLEIVI